MWSKHDVCECGNGAVSTLDLCGCAVPVITTEKSTWKMWQPGQGSPGRWELPTHLIVPMMPHTREGQATRDVGAKPWLSASLSDPGTGAKAVACATDHTHTALKMLHVFLACFQVLQGAGRKQG